MLAVVVAKFRYLRNIPHLTGKLFGFPLMLIIAGLGPTNFILSLPSVEFFLKYLSAIIILWFAFEIIKFNQLKIIKNYNVKLFTFIEALLFNLKSKRLALILVSILSFINI